MTDFATEWFRVGVGDDGSLQVDGDIDMATGPVLGRAIAECEAVRPVVLDLSRVNFIDSSGLRTLLEASRRADERNQVVILRAIGPEIRRLLEITGTTAKFELEG